MASPAVTFGEAARVWARVGLQSFGGPAGQIALMHRILVDERRWLSESRFLHALNFCMFLPGPEAMQLAIYAGWLLHGHAGGIVAGALFVLPGFVTVLGLAYLYVAFQGAPPVAALMFGLKAAVLAIVIQAFIRISRRALVSPFHAAVAVAAFISLFLFEAPFPLVVAAAAIAGLLRSRARPLERPAGASLDEPADALEPRAGGGRAARWGVAAALALLWLGPVALLVAWLGPGHILAQQGVFFSKAALVTFGGAYSVLTYIAQQAVYQFRWLTPPEMLDGLGLAETTPGPLILVLPFVGFLAAWKNPGGLAPLAAACLGALLTAWVTFVPSFLMVFVGAPFMESTRRSRALAGALAAITSAVVGVMANLSLWFALHTLFTRIETRQPGAGLRLLVPAWESFDPAAFGIAVAACVAIFRHRAGVLPTLAGGAAAGLIVEWFIRR